MTQLFLKPVDLCSGFFEALRANPPIAEYFKSRIELQFVLIGKNCLICHFANEYIFHFICSSHYEKQFAFTYQKPLNFLPFLWIFLIIDIVERSLSPRIMQANVTTSRDNGSQNRQVSAPAHW